jgi:hypothetical protein
VPGVQADDQELGLPLMGRVGLAAEASTFTLGWDETEFGRLMKHHGGGVTGDYILLGFLIVFQLVVSTMNIYLQASVVL